VCLDVGLALVFLDVCQALVRSPLNP
jgi:hypothetical protein